MPMPPESRVLLTGATGGIGQAIARQLLAAGAKLLLQGRDANALAALQQQLGQPDAVRTIAADLCVAADRARIADAARRFPGGINTVIHNAGWNQFGLFEEQSVRSIDYTVQLNLQAPMLLTHELLPLLHLQRGAHLVFITSTFGRIGHPGYAAYAAAKFGLTGFAESLRRELSDCDITVTTLSPRATRTALNPANVVALNAALKVQMDEPAVVASAVVDALRTRPARRQLGWPEKLFVRINAVFPRLVDRALAKQLPLVKRYARS